MNKIEGYPSYIKDNTNGAIINTDNSALETYKLQKQRLSKIQKLEKENEELRQSMDRMQKMLDLIYEKVASK